jgi:hypothetical protein
MPGMQPQAAELFMELVLGPDEDEPDDPEEEPFADDQDDEEESA